MRRKLVGAISAGIAAGLMTIGAGAAIEGWEDWDLNDNGIEANEWNDGFGEAGIYDAWDADGDGDLTEDEFNEGVFDSYDVDDSGIIEEPEYGDLGDDMGDGGFWDV